MANLYAPAISNEMLLSQMNLRHIKINLDYEYIARFPGLNVYMFRHIHWQCIEFNRNEVDRLGENRGIYMFTFSPYSFSLAQHSADMILYIGQADRLRSRLGDYFYYPNSKKASDQARRYMVLFFSGFLKVYYYETGNIPQSELDELEHGLIDSILPPFNLRVYSELAQAYRRLIN